ncbi:PAS domain S-box-containing protein [Mucilaginibacter oryzae]|uniref:PAS domain S-box-containing protein n=1 Tax=Mucilaginibacter oryzae TaxID=468058 RepID=A0A316HQ07_9SPHI|nr:PAS domain S-box protein [Mucilaginibacter oryzae]PWK80315.1 PAS domain S-box-containing protein [Mucilaginibacter oryzae]
MDNQIISLFAKSKDVFFVMDMNNVVLHTNGAFRETFNYTEQDLTGLNIIDLPPC